MDNLNLTDETFDVNQSHNYFLSMQSSLGGFSYVISDTVRNKCILLKHYQSKCTDWNDFYNFILPVLESDTNLSLKYKGIHHVIIDQYFTIIPLAFNPDAAEIPDSNIQEHFRGNSIMVSSESVTSKSNIVSPYPENLHNLLRQKFNNVRLSHHTVPFIYNLVTDSNRSLRHVFHLMVHQDFITIGVAHSGGLDFVNTFKTRSVEDIIFYTMSVLERFKASPLLAEIFLLDETGTPGLNIKLQAFIGKVRIMKAPHSLVYSYVLTEEVLERFTNLINVYHCE